MDDQVRAEFDPELAALIKHKVRWLIGHYGFTSSDAPDLEQELYLQTFKAISRHDADRASLKTYADRVVSSKRATIIEGQSAQKRDWRRHGHLGDGDAAIADHRTPQDSDVDAKLREALGSLDPELQAWAALLATHTQAETIQLTGFPRGKVREMRRRLAEEFRRLGLDPEKKTSLNNQSAHGSGR